MKLFKKISFSILSISCIAFCCITNANRKSVTGVLADEDDPIGYFYTYERVHDHYKVVIPSYKIPFIEEAGRTVHMEMVSGGGLIPINPDFPIGPLNNGTPIEPNSFDHLVPQYYYWAETYNGIILEKKPLYNDFNSLKIILNQLEDDADFYMQNNYSGLASDEYLKKKNNLIMGYLRTIQGAYDSDFWSLTAGAIDIGFVNYINSLRASNNEGILTINDYLSLFSEQASSHIDFIDPLNPTGNIDLIHMFASIDGVVLRTDRSSLFGWSNNINYVRHASSWGADLQQACACIGNNGNLFSSMTQIFGNFAILNAPNPPYSFDWKDFYSDMYAVNIAANFNVCYENIIDSIIDYFTDETIENRLTHMLLRMADISQIDYNNLHHLHSTIYNMLALSDDGSFSIYGLAPWDYKKYTYLLVGNSVPSVSSRRCIADLFYSFMINGY